MIRFAVLLLVIWAVCFYYNLLLNGYIHLLLMLALILLALKVLQPTARRR